MKTKLIAHNAVIAAMYAVITIAIAPIAFGPVQLRISEIMTLLAFISPAYIPGLVIGCLFANLASPYGLLDIAAGTLATAIAVVGISKTKNLILASLWPVIVNGIIIGAVISISAGLPFAATALGVAIDEFVVVTLIGCPIFYFAQVILKKYVYGRH